MKECPNCNSKLVIAPISSIFDPSGIKFGGFWSCPKCGWHSLDKFPTSKEINDFVKEVKK